MSKLLQKVKRKKSSLQEVKQQKEEGERQYVRNLVAGYSSGNIRLTQGKYSTESDIEARKKELLASR